MDHTAPERRSPVKGSWEDLLAQAEEYSSNFNDAAIPLYQRVMDGIAKLSPAARNAGNRRLFNLYMRAAFNLQGYFNVRNRVDDALAVLQQMRDVVIDTHDLDMIDLMTAQINLTADRFEEGIAYFRTQAEAPDAPISRWHTLAWAYVESGRAADALPLLPKLAAMAQAESPSSTPAADEDDDTELSSNPLARYLSLRGLVMLEAGLLEEAQAAYDQLLDMGSEFSSSAFAAYTRLAQQGHYEAALRYLDRDRKRPLRAAFWRGLILRRMGEAKRARHFFENAANPDAARQDQRSVVEHILAQYFLGDPDAKALEAVLHILREGKTITWPVLMLAGFGWAVRGDYVAARNNFRLAAAQIKWSADGRGIPRLYWFIAQALIPAEHHAEIREYFDTRVFAPAGQPGASSVNAPGDDVAINAPGQADSHA